MKTLDRDVNLFFNSSEKGKSSMEINPERQRRSIKHAFQSLTLEQVRQFLNAAQDPALKALLTLAITTGLRGGELLGLHWQDIDMQDEVVHIRRVLSCIGERGSTNTARTIALPKIAVQALNE